MRTKSVATSNRVYSPAQLPSREPAVVIDLIVRRVAATLGADVARMRSQKRHFQNSGDLAIAVCLTVSGCSLCEIAEYFGRRPNVLNKALHRFNDALENLRDEAYAGQIASICTIFGIEPAQLAYVPHRIDAISIAEAAIKKQALSQQANTTSVARALGFHRSAVAKHLDKNPDQRRRFRIVKNSGSSWRTTEFFSQYEIAAKKIRTAGGWPCPSSLAKELGFRQKRVGKYMAAHPDLALRTQYIGGLIGNSADMICRAAHAMKTEGVPICRRALADRAHVCYATLNRVLKARPAFVEELSIVRAAYGTAGW